MRNNWVVTLTYSLEPDSDTMDRWEDMLDEFDATVARVPGRGVDVTVHADRTTLDDALTLSLQRVAVAVPAEPRAAEIVSEEDQLRRAAVATMPELMSAAEIALELGVSRQRVHQLRSSAAFPAPLADLRGGAVWSADAVRRFAREWNRKPGRPASGLPVANAQ
jgi:hypothetical protein